MTRRSARRAAAERRHRDERGAALVEMVWLGLLLLLPMIWILVSVFEVQRGAYAASAAARSAGRAYVLAETDAIGQVRAEAAARQAFRDQGIDDPPQLTVTVECEPYADCHSGTSVVTVDIGSRVDLPLVPDALGGGGALSFPVDATHSVPVGRYQEITR